CRQNESSGGDSKSQRHERQCASISRTMRPILIILFVCVSVFVPVQEPQTTQIKGIKDRVTIRRDERGIPYIEAQNDEDLYFGQGYATASDRLWQMDLFRRTARGELAEMLGAGPNNVVVDQDKLHRTYGFSQTADAEY